MKITRKQLRQIIKEQAAVTRITRMIQRIAIGPYKGKTIESVLAKHPGLEEPMYIEGVGMIYPDPENPTGPATTSPPKATKTESVSVTRRQLRRLISEVSWSDETGSDLLDFAKSYASLGGAVQEQIDSIVSAYFHHGLKSQEFQEAVYEVNPAAVEMAIGRMGRAIRYLGTDEAEDIMTVLETAQKIYVEGDEEVTQDQIAAGDTGEDEVDFDDDGGYESQWDEADQDYADQQYAEKHGNPWED